MKRAVATRALHVTSMDDAPLDFQSVYTAWFHPTLRWLRAFGVAESELEDVAQEVFLVVQAKLARFDGRNLAGWLFAIAARRASDHRRGAWHRRLFRRPRAVHPDAL